MLTFTAMHKAFLDANCRIFGMSNDTQRSLGAYSEHLKISIPLLSDEGARLARLLGARKRTTVPGRGSLSAPSS